jgi:hypothetical protein
MLKWFGVAGAAILIVAVVLVARYDETHDTESKGYEVKCVQSNDPSATAPSLVCTVEHSQKQMNGEYQPVWWHVFFAWPEGITALLLMLTLGAIIWQAWETRKAAFATADSANAAYGSVVFAEAQFELMKEERRARISIKAKGVQVQDPDSELWNLVTSIEIRNLGQTRAFIKRTSGKFAIRAHGEERPEEDDLSALYLPEEYIDPRIDPVVVALYQFNLSPTSLKVLADYLHDRSRMLHLYGFIEYETLGMKFTEEFKYFWMPGSFMRGTFSGEETNPTDAERVEDGHWWDNRPQPEDEEQPPN